MPSNSQKRGQRDDSGILKLLIFEFVLPDIGAPQYPALLDIHMMALFSGMQRTETQWRALLDSVNLQIVKFWKHDDLNTDELIREVLQTWRWTDRT